ncbi:DUF4127 family protein [bacterium]|nr:DUF4127 family protein [bacterium]
MKICVIPIDNRPVCYNLLKDIAQIDKSIELYLPPREHLGDLTKSANLPALFNWLENCPKCDAIILSLDTIAYGGLIPSRRSTETFDEIKTRIEKLKTILVKKEAKIYAFSSIMRISNNNYNEEEKEYWKDFGKKIFEYSYSEGKKNLNIPESILNDYLSTRKRNFEINKLYLDWQKEGLFETLIFSKDDCAEFGFNVEEAKTLELLGGKTKTGADEIPLTLFAKAIKKEIKVYIEYIEPDCKNLISNYEDISIEKSILGQLELADIKTTSSKDKADVILIINNFREKQGELVMNWDTGASENYILSLDTYNKPYCVADVRYTNGADNFFIEKFLPQINLEKFYGYAGWNTSANTLGSLLACLKVRFKASSYDEHAFKKLQLIRFLDDWAYQANIRALIDKPCEIANLMKPFEEKLSIFLPSTNKTSLEKTFEKRSYSFPWNRKFEVEITL